MDEPGTRSHDVAVTLASDEPTRREPDPEGGPDRDVPRHPDGLGRERLARHVAAVIGGLEESSSYTLAVYGGWGEGKTRLLREVEQKVRALTDGDGQPACRTVWFDLWVHQHDVNPVIALLQTARQALYDQSTPLGKAVSATCDAVVPLLWTALDTLPAAPGGGWVTGARQRHRERRETRMEVQDAQVRLRDLFHKALADLAGDRRLVFFVDDLDRCLPHQVVDLLEKIRLFMDHERCVFVIGVDPVAVAQETKGYDNPQIAGQYLEKMIQYAFDLPPVEPAQRRVYTTDILRSVLRWPADGSADEPWAGRVVAGPWEQAFVDPEVDASVRLIKRTVNTFAVDHLVGSAELGERYVPTVMAVLSAIKSCYRGAFDRLRHRHADRVRDKGLWQLLFRYVDAAPDKTLRQVFAPPEEPATSGHEPDQNDGPETEAGSWSGRYFVQAVQSLRDDQIDDDERLSALLAADDAELGRRVEEHFQLALSSVGVVREHPPGAGPESGPAADTDSPASAERGQVRTDPGASSVSEEPLEIERLGRLPGLVDYQKRRQAVEADMTDARDSIVRQGVGGQVVLGGIRWKVLALSSPPDEALLLADRVIGTGPYNQAQVAMTWERCDLRAWLNGPFLDSLGGPFRTRVVQKRVVNQDNPTWGTRGGNDTHDRVFLLSMREPARYLAGKDDVDWEKYRQGEWFGQQPDEVGLVAMNEEGERAWWWLRSPGRSPGRAALVSDDGRLSELSGRVSWSSGGVRPALWLNLESTAP